VHSPEPLAIEVLAYAPTVFYHCQHCELTFQQVGIGDRVHRQHAREALPDDLRDEFHALSDWIHSLGEEYGPRVQVKVVDAASIEGVLKSLKHRVSRYPAVILDGDRFVRPDLARLRHEVDERMRAMSSGNAPARGGDALGHELARNRTSDSAAGKEV
jgi:hypothetical protein